MKQIKRVEKRLTQKINEITVRLFASVIKPASRLARQVFEFKHIQRMLGLLVVSSVFSLAVLPVSVSSLQTVIDTNFTLVQAEETEITTERSIRLPVESFTITQGYRLFHPGIDMAAVKGTPVYPIMDGVVVKVGRDRFAYGNHVIVEHGSGLQSLYAHMAKIEAKEGEKVTKDSILGLLGSTGWSTGPHLHLQIEQNGHWTNPRTFFEGYFGRRLISTR